MSAAAILVAGGSGARLGGAVPKQFQLLAGRPLLAHALRRLARSACLDGIVLVLPADDFDRHRERIRGWEGEEKIRAVVPGGAERQDSVEQGLQALPADFRGLVLIHDAARPLLSEALIEATVRAAEAHGAALAALPVHETVKEVGAGRRVEKTLDRERLFRAQTPQAFQLEVLRAAFERARRESFRATDEAALVEHLGLPVQVVAGSERNIKITTAEDLALAEYYLQLEAGA